MDPAPDLRLLDEIAAAATVAPDQAEVAGWWCKAAPDLPFRRCNVVLPPADAAADRDRFLAALAEVRRWYHRRGLRLSVQVSTAMTGHEEIDRWLASDGLAVEAPVHVLVAQGAPAGAGRSPSPAPPTGTTGPAVEVSNGIDAQWAEAYGLIHGGDATAQARTRAYGRMLAVFGDRALGASCVIDGEVVGVGFGVVDRGWLGIFGMGTAPSHRRRGVASAVVQALRAAAHPQGVDRVYLQVEVDNLPALRLYDGLGFQLSHDYHYRSEGSDPDQGC